MGILEKEQMPVIFLTKVFFSLLLIYVFLSLLLFPIFPCHLCCLVLFSYFFIMCEVALRLLYFPYTNLTPLTIMHH